MSFQCPACLKPTLRISRVIHLLSDALWDEIAVQLVTCECGFSGAAVYEEERRGRLDEETSRHYGYKLSAEQSAQFKEMLDACPNLNDENCECPTHLAMNASDDMDFRIGIRAVAPRGSCPTFPMKSS
ncbi:MAG: hypothetical protein DCC64_00130 [Planctomycetota bacterium]|nr:MAG: hypothetical protein DCC64_00130 [Planctomycetota bacterium]